MRGKFIVFEGVDSCGKDTQQDLLLNYLKKENPENLKEEDFVFVRVLDENTVKGKKLREVIFNKDFRWDTISEILLFYADRFEMMKTIEEAINSGKHVVCNRFELSQYAYQIHGKQREDLRDISIYMTKLVQKNLQPDLYIYFDIDAMESQTRKNIRTATTDKYEDYYDNAKIDFINRVIAGYKLELEKLPHKKIDGMKSREEVFKDTLETIKNIIQ